MNKLYVFRYKECFFTGFAVKQSGLIFLTVSKKIYLMNKQPQMGRTT